ncbi:hypothetical protein Taro_012958 [Colocasia esculenta]|uniref:PCI domain-containing protein n=1 Tax=Colocasia esculenta TaxID=4460 RepID=A0A843UF10_COLES|nr:hypothetical protein [Colocasia esculenta]
MDIEQQQAELIDHFVKQAGSLTGAAGLPHLATFVTEATSHPSLFAFSEILSVPALAELEGTPYSSSLEVLRLFAYGTWSDYKSNVGCLPALLPDQVRKLKQLSVLTLAETNKILLYDQLMLELDVSNVRELEDFLINECMYAGIVRGKLDQLRRCFEVQFAAGRDLRRDQLNNMIKTILVQSPYTLTRKLINNEQCQSMCLTYLVAEVPQFKQADMDLRGHEEIIYSEPGGVMDYEEDRAAPSNERASLIVGLPVVLRWILSIMFSRIGHSKSLSSDLAVGVGPEPVETVGMNFV